ncbi:unnamed protein product [Callosobruchus maculatus]|uniref:Uncharacterized protein n=1 Tax=Callosobruchus maculatus TaxID=64391 RepID=A0A653BMN3_CALMS|nr:unnamed protein product [Callosobruchus maculatus]
MPFGVKLETLFRVQRMWSWGVSVSDTFIQTVRCSVCDLKSR